MIRFGSNRVKEFDPDFISYPNNDCFLLLLELVMTSIPVATVAKAMVTDAENYMKSKESGGDLQSTPSSVTYENAEIEGNFLSNSRIYCCTAFTFNNNCLVNNENIWIITFCQVRDIGI